MEFQLRKWKKEDIEDVARFADNKKIASNLRDAFPHPYALEDAREYVDSCIQNTEERQICRAIMVDGHAVGVSAFSSVTMFTRNPENWGIGWQKNTEARGS